MCTIDSVKFTWTINVNNIYIYIYIFFFFPNLCYTITVIMREGKKKSFLIYIFFHSWKKTLLNSKNSATVSLVLNFKLNKNHHRDMYWLIFFIKLFMLKWKIEGHSMFFPSLCLSPSATFFPSKFKSRTQYLNNGDGISKHVSPLVLYKFFTKVHFWP